MASENGEQSGSVSLSRTERVLEVAMDEEGVPVLSAKDFKRLSDFIASGHLNFLLGSGFSWSAGIPVLGNREGWFTGVEHYGADESIKCAMDLLLKAEYYSSVLLPACRVAPQEDQTAFARALHSILKNRGNTSIPKRANVFTTNYDLVLEQAFEVVGFPYNDGFEGRIFPAYSTGSFSRVLMSQSMEHEYMSQVPMANLMKMHGSLSWRRSSGLSIGYNDGKETLLGMSCELFPLHKSGTLENVMGLVAAECDGDGLEALSQIADGLEQEEIDALDGFSNGYEELCIVNPTKRKFSETVLELAYYELMRIYSNELDRTNALLIAHGFSFDDEHVLSITKRALRNPKLVLVVSCHDRARLEGLESKFAGCDNVWYMAGSQSVNPPPKITTEVLASLLEKVGSNG